ncbi:MAG: ABC-F family ATP-binding cassette domain-containing protein [Bdellovibrionota bacterium]
MSNLLQLKNGEKHYGIRTIFEGASFAVNAGERIGVIGPNGAGKTTLFKILMGEESLDGGEITRASGLRVGYLAQEDRWVGDPTVEEVLASQSMTPLWDVKRWAPAFGLETSRFGDKVKSLSGGYRMRVKLLHMMASQPDLMLLDEPTNYLDLETLVVLENFLLDAPGAFLLISHDREFLRRTTDHILEVEGGLMTKYAGNIDDYFEQKELLRSQLEKAAMNAAAKRKEVLDFAARFGAKATKARQVQSRLKRLDKMESIEVRALPLKARIRLPEPGRTGRSIVRVDEGQFGYGAKTILRGVQLELEKGDHLAVVGVNGAGKSTLLKALAGELEPLAGKIAHGTGVDVAYFAQHVAERLKPEDTVLEAMGQYARPETKRQEILDLAGSLLFGGDDVYKKVRLLSGGEKSRVALGQMLLKRSSLLLLDEPTNHLDFHTVEALTQALAEYEGAFVVVSHDRGFVRRAASKILEIQNGKAEFYPGTYEEYVWSVQKGALSLRRSGSGSGDEIISEDSVGRTERFNFKEAKKALEKELRTCERDIARLDVDMAKKRDEMVRLNESLTAASGPAANEAARSIGTLQKQIDEMDESYLKVLERHEVVERELASIENRRTE